MIASCIRARQALTNVMNVVGASGTTLPLGQHSRHVAGSDVEIKPRNCMSVVHTSNLQPKKKRTKNMVNKPVPSMHAYVAQTDQGRQFNRRLPNTMYMHPTCLHRFEPTKGTTLLQAVTTLPTAAYFHFLLFCPFLLLRSIMCTHTRRPHLYRLLQHNAVGVGGEGAGHLGPVELGRPHVHGHKPVLSRLLRPSMHHTRRSVFARESRRGGGG